MDGYYYYDSDQVGVNVHILANNHYNQILKDQNTSIY